MYQIDLMKTGDVIQALIITIITLSTFTPVKNCSMNGHFRQLFSQQNASCMVNLCCLINKMATLIPEVVLRPMKVSCSAGL